MTKSILQMDPTPNFGVFSDFIHPFLTEVDFRNLIATPPIELSSTKHKTQSQSDIKT